MEFILGLFAFVAFCYWKSTPHAFRGTNRRKFRRDIFGVIGGTIFFFVLLSFIGSLPSWLQMILILLFILYSVVT